MWKCSSCQNENKDEYRFCLQCGEPRPAAVPVPKKPESERPVKKTAATPSSPKKKASSKRSEDQNLTRTILLLAFALILVLAVVAILFFLGSSSNGKPAETRPAPTSAADSTEEPGGSSIFIIGGETAAPASAAPASAAPAVITPDPIPVASPSPLETEPAPTAAPVGDYLIPDSDSRYVTEADLQNLSWQQCTLARNEIYARHGRKFLTKEISDYFNSKSWYHGTIEPDAFSEAFLSEIERANVNYIKQYETTHWGGSYY